MSPKNMYMYSNIVVMAGFDNSIYFNVYFVTLNIICIQNTYMYSENAVLVLVTN